MTSLLETRRNYSWWCPQCRRAGRVPIWTRDGVLEPPAWFVEGYARDLHAFEFLESREDAEPMCPGDELEIAEIKP